MTELSKDILDSSSNISPNTDLLLGDTSKTPLTSEKTSLLEKRNTQRKSFKDLERVWKNGTYSPLLNRKELSKSMKRDIWQYELKSMLHSFMNNIHDFKDHLRFRVSGKVLDSSTYVLKKKTSRIINHSLDAQEDIEEAQKAEEDVVLESDNSLDISSNKSVILTPDTLEEYLPEELMDEFDHLPPEDFDYDDGEILEAFAELESENLLTEEQKEAFIEEKVNRLIDNFGKDELNQKIANKLDHLHTPQKIIYKRVDLQDLAEALDDVLKNPPKPKKAKSKRKKGKLDKDKLPFLPEKLFNNAEKKREAFQERINLFYDNLVNNYDGAPVSFLKVIPEPTRESLVDTLLIVLHLINHQKIELWKSYTDEEDGLVEIKYENSGKQVLMSPLLEKKSD